MEEEIILNQNVREDEEEIQEEEKKQPKSKEKALTVRKYIKKTKWKYVNFLSQIKQTHLFYLYGSVVLFTDYSPEIVHNTNVIDLVSRYQSTNSVSINKQLNSIETNFNVLNPGMLDFSFLVSHYERKQNQLYYNFAQSLKDFKIFVDTLNRKIVEKKKTLKNLTKVLDKLDEQYETFERWSYDMIDKHYKDEFYVYSLYYINYRKGYLEVKKHASSQNMISLYGQTMEDIYECEVCKMKNKQVAFERNQDFDIEQFLESITFSLKCASKQTPYDTQKITFRTIEGFQIPVVSENYYLKYSDFKKDDKNYIFVNENDYVLFVNTVKVDNFWLKKLLDIREEMAQYKKPKNPPVVIPHVEKPSFQMFDSFANHEHILNTLSKDESSKTDFESSRSSIKLNEFPSNTEILSSEIVENSFNNEDKMSDEPSYFIPQEIDLVGNEYMTAYLENQEDQKQKKEKLADCLNKYFVQRDQEIELSTIEYSCQVEYFIDKFYSDDQDAQKGMKQCQFKMI